jgi:hypothetical protein
MAREIVTKSRRFYCVSLKPDICKTPIGKSIPPIPYTIKGEFTQASGVSLDIKSHGEPVVLHASTVIPTVTGDSPGRAKGIKSGTVGKRVQHDEKSKSVTFNGEQAIRKGDTVWMNDKNTNGKVYERGGEAAQPLIQTGNNAASPPPEQKGLGDKFDDVMFAGANKINAGTQWLGNKVNDLAQTQVGGNVMQGLTWVSEKTELTVVKKWKEGLEAGVDGAVEGISGRGMMAAGALTQGALAMIPTSLLDLIPGGKAAGSTAKVTSTVNKLEHAAEAAQKANKSGQAAADASKGANLTPESGGAGKTPQNGKDGGKSKNSRSGEIGKCGEWLARNALIQDEGFDQVVEVQNNSGHGMDLIGRNSETGAVKVLEVKTTTTASAPELSKAQKELGGKNFTNSRLDRAARGVGNYGKVPAAMKNARIAQRWINKANGKVSYEKREVFVDDLDKGCMEHPNRPQREKPWITKK